MPKHINYTRCFETYDGDEIWELTKRISLVFATTVPEMMGHEVWQIIKEISFCAATRGNVLDEEIYTKNLNLLKKDLRVYGL